MKTEEKKAQHTAAPWVILPRDIDQKRITINTHYDELRSVPLRGGCLGVYLRHGEPGTVEEANARRIVAAVNACEGIPTEALESGVVGEMLIASECAIAQFEFVARAIDEINQPAWKDIADGCRKQVSVIRAVLAKAKGE